MNLLTIDGVSVNLDKLLYTEIRYEAGSHTSVLAHLDSRNYIRVIEIVRLPYKPVVASELMSKIMRLVEDGDGMTVIDAEELDELAKDAVDDVEDNLNIRKDSLLATVE